MASCVEFVFDTFTPARIKALAFRTPTRRSAIGMRVLLAFVCGSPLPYPAKRPVIVSSATKPLRRQHTALSLPRPLDGHLSRAALRLREGLRAVIELYGWEAATLAKRLVRSSPFQIGRPD